MRVQEQPNEFDDELRITIIGAGGIGSNLVSPAVKALHSGALLESLGSVRVRLYDSDLVEESNLAHQNFTPDDVGRYKVEAVMQPLLTFQSDKLILEAIAEDVRSPDPILDADIVVVAVDSMEARRLVHRYSHCWLDLRCQGDGFVAVDFRVDPRVTSKLTPIDAPRASCQLPGAIESGNIQFGHLLAAAHGAQWILQCLRILAGSEVAMPPNPQSANITFGTLGRFDAISPELQPTPAVSPHIHPQYLLNELVERGDHDSLPIKETLAAFAIDEDWRSLWLLADKMGREVSLLFDAEDRVWVDVGTSGQVRVAPPEGSKIPYKLWIHTHPRDAYWSSTDIDSILMFSTILEEAIVLGHDHLKRSVRCEEPTDYCLERGGELEYWSEEPTTKYELVEEIIDAN